MATEQRGRLFVLALLVVALAAVLYSAWPTSTTPAASSNPQSARNGAAAGARVDTAPAVHLDALDGARPKPATDRDLFRFKPKAPPPPVPGLIRPTAPQATMAAPPSGPPPPPSVPPIGLKFIGVMGTNTSKWAVLSDGRGAPFYGHEGEIVDGRYRILKIGVESIDIAYADGRGRQTIRLTGQ